VAKPYDAVVKAYQDGDFQKLQAEVNVGLQVWDEVSRVESMSLTKANYCIARQPRAGIGTDGIPPPILHSQSPEAICRGSYA
jgi:hypothetical protein